ncbi:glycerol-3-phosphate phosphatase [Scaptodrosophila lebanonensis]|uniref:Glycerol-3-phosphate phosphatase n=1 Tax=Drosophila lebanonensis TaxID=7225 RepID=A0A6J2UA12_DROLE|nr:glycerol-3-phosphate phosphatase [Scaptodrosophila lebanonensis]
MLLPRFTLNKLLVRCLNLTMAGRNSQLTPSNRSSSQSRSSNSKQFKQTCTQLLDLPPAKVTEWLQSFDAVISDCDGVLWVYGKAIEGSVDVMNQLKSMGKSIYFCTNNSTKTRSELLVKGVELGFNIDQNSIISTAHATAAYLKQRNFNKRVYVIGSTGITQELDAVGIKHTDVGPDPMPGSLNEFMTQHLKLDTDIGAVVVGFDEHFSFPKMTKAATYLNDKKCLFIATNTDERFPMPTHVVPGSGSFVRAIQTCAEREPFIIGKPNPAICEQLIRANKVNPARTLMIGDRANTDILLGYNCGFQTLLVGSGIHQLSDVEQWKKSNNPEDKKLIPDVYLPKLGDLLPALLTDRANIY